MVLQAEQVERLSQLYPGLEPQRLIETVTALGFSAHDYLRTNRDLVAVGLDADAATYHYLTGGGLDECRRFDRADTAGDRRWVGALDRLPLDAPAARKLMVNLLLNRMWHGPALLDADRGVQRDLLLACRRAGMRPVVVIGDSHCQAYRVPHDVGGVVHVPLVMVCHGGSAAGLANARSRSGFGQQINHWFAKHRALLDEFKLPCFFKFGQVDAEFVWAFKRAQLGEIDWSIAGFEAFAEAAVTRYMQFCGQLCNTHGLGDQLRICSIFPPTLSDASWHAGYVNARIGRLESNLDLDDLSDRIKRLVIPTQSERTRLHALWNARVMAECARRGWLYVDDFQLMLAYRGVVDEAYVQGHDGADHHLAVTAVADVVESVFTRYSQVASGLA